MKKAAISVILYDRLGIIATITSVSSIGLDMIALPGNTSADTIAAIIADEMVIGVINRKTTAARLIPVPGKKAGDIAHFILAVLLFPLQTHARN